MKIQLGLFSTIGIVFLILKLTGSITWSWIWVLCPFWIPFGLVAFLLMILGLIALIENM